MTQEGLTHAAPPQVVAPPGSFPPSGGTITLLGSDGTLADYSFASAEPLPADEPEVMHQMVLGAARAVTPPYALSAFPVFLPP